MGGGKVLVGLPSQPHILLPLDSSRQTVGWGQRVLVPALPLPGLACLASATSSVKSRVNIPIYQTSYELSPF